MSYRTVFSLLIILCLSVFTVKPLLLPGFFPMHDDTQPSRVYEMAKALTDGQFPVRWVADLGYGYGYPIFNFYAPLAYYFGAQFSIVGFDAITATKIMMVFGFLIAGVSMYFLAREFWGDYGGILSALLYMYAPYHAINIYVRGDVAEFWAYGFAPLIFLGLYRVYKSKTKDQKSNSQFKNKSFLWFWISVTAIAYAAVILSHNLTALMITPFVVFEILLLAVVSYQSSKKIHTTYYLILATFLGILVSAFYWFPIPFEMGYTNVLSQIGGKAEYSQHFVCPGQLWNSPWGFGGSTIDCFDGMSYRIGKLHIILAILAIGFGIFGIVRKKHSEKNVAILFAGILLVIGIWLTTVFAKPVWDLVSFMSFFQYPWRFLLVISLFSSFLGGAIIWIIETRLSDKKLVRIVPLVSLILFIAGIFFLYGKLFQPQTILPKTEKDYVAEDALKWDVSKISDEYLPKNFDKPETKSEIIRNPLQYVREGNGAVAILQNKTGYMKAEVSSDDPEDIRINIAPFPAWKFFVDGSQVYAKADTRGYVVSVFSTTHIIEARYKQTLVQVIANLLSLTGIVVIILAIMRTRLSNQSR